MESEIEDTFNYSGTTTPTEFSNSSNITTESMSSEETTKWINEEITRLIQIIFRPILIIAGTVGNGLTVYIMKRTSLKHLSPCFYIFILAIADTSKCTFIHFINFLQNVCYIALRRPTSVVFTSYSGRQESAKNYFHM